jgi:hypothetical protein
VNKEYQGRSSRFSRIFTYVCQRQYAADDKLNV